MAQLFAPIFVVLWSTGFIGAKLGLPYAEPMTFLGVRFALAAVILALWVQISQAPWPRGRQVVQQAVIGILVHVCYLGGVFSAIAHGMEAGVAAVIVGLQPIATALLAWAVLRERLVAWQWAGMVLGLAGVILVVWQKLGVGTGDGWAILLCASGLAAIAVGTVLQKRGSAATPMRGGNAVQFAAAALTCLVAAFVLETMVIDWTPEFVFALGWLVLVLSIGAVMLFYTMIRRGAAGPVASLFFLVPPSTVIIAWILFGETFGLVETAGMLASAIGVWLVNRPPKGPRPPGGVSGKP